MAFWDQLCSDMKQNLEQITIVTSLLHITSENLKCLFDLCMCFLCVIHVIFVYFIFVVHPSDVSPFVAQEGVKYAIHISLHRIYYIKQESPLQKTRVFVIWTNCCGPVAWSE